MASATAAPISRVRRASIAQANATTQLATASNAPSAQRTALLDNTVAVVAARVLAHVRIARTSLQTPRIQARAL